MLKGPGSPTLEEMAHRERLGKIDPEGVRQGGTEELPECHQERCEEWRGRIDVEGEVHTIQQGAEERP